MKTPTIAVLSALILSAVVGKTSAERTVTVVFATDPDGSASVTVGSTKHTLASSYRKGAGSILATIKSLLGRFPIDLPWTTQASMKRNDDGGATLAVAGIILPMSTQDLGQIKEELEQILEFLGPVVN